MRLLSIFLLIFTFISTGCSFTNKIDTANAIVNNEHKLRETQEAEIDVARQVLIAYFETLRNNSYDEEYKYLSSRKLDEYNRSKSKRKGITFKYAYLNVNKITYNDSDKMVEDYYEGKTTKPYKVIIFDTDFEYEFSPYDPLTMKKEKQKREWHYILIKENDTWKIDDFGY